MHHADLDKLKKILILAKDQLRDDEFVILAKRYGLDDKPPLSVAELANIFRMDGNEIRKISRIAFFKLRDYTYEKQWFDDLLVHIFTPKRI